MGLRSTLKKIWDDISRPVNRPHNPAPEVLKKLQTMGYRFEPNETMIKTPIMPVMFPTLPVVTIIYDVYNADGAAVFKDKTLSEKYDQDFRNVSAECGYPVPPKPQRESHAPKPH